MRCVNCGEQSVYTIYKGNALCWHCFEYARLQEIIKLRKVRDNVILSKETQEKIKEFKHWIEVTRLANEYNLPEII